MSTKYLLHFAHEHLSFRWTEFLSLTSKYNCKFKLLSEKSHIDTRPYILIQLENSCDEQSLVDSAKDSYLLKGLYELWAEANTIEDLNRNVANSTYHQKKLYSSAEHTFCVRCESFGTKLSQPKKVEMIRKMMFLDEIDARPNLTNPMQLYGIFVMNHKTNNHETAAQEFYFGRHLATSDRAAIDRFSLKKRIFIANTSMDSMLSLIMANAARVKPNDIVYDPFVGSGSLLVAAAYKGAYVMGGDIDWKLLHGQSRPTRVGLKSRSKGESVRENMKQYNIESRYIDVMISDISRKPIVKNLRFDSIISDPPYGVRECSEKIGLKKREPKPLVEGKLRFPSKISYRMSDLLIDLLELSAHHLVVNGRLIYYLPIAHAKSNCEEFIPRHPSLSLVSYCRQDLTGNVSRLMIVMEKTKEPEINDSVVIPRVISDVNLREVYFTKNENLHRIDGNINQLEYDNK